MTNIQKAKFLKQTVKEVLKLSCSDEERRKHFDNKLLQNGFTKEEITGVKVGELLDEANDLLESIEGTRECVEKKYRIRRERVMKQHPYNNMERSNALKKIRDAEERELAKTLG